MFLKPRKLKSVLERVNQQMYMRNLELAQTNRTLSLLRTIDKLVLESEETTEKLCDRISHAISQATSYPLVAILAQPPRKAGSLRVYGWNSRLPVDGRTKARVSSLSVSTSNIAWLKANDSSILTPLKTITSKREHILSSQIDANSVVKLGHEIGVRSVYIVKLTAREHLVGLMVVGLVSDSAEEALSENDQDLIERLAGAVGIALDNKFLLEENIRVLEQLQRTNKKLKALDETKDEFISMASHQLRTPLTSVKGYMSMVLEGDAGELNKAQKELLKQAFVSSQRMVYLIADLLNVSRLKTGKFVIEPFPTNLSEVVEGELSQLKEVAKSKKLTLNYKKPKDFPTLMLDETKIRQVIMNFADNAIYYTPSGGKISIELKEDRQNIYFLVKDNGLGVPKDEQSKLFTKFYRAKNARKARPDGTGLGLFMAKKVINAQGGDIIFESHEGQGSTFGFTFTKSKLSPKKA